MTSKDRWLIENCEFVVNKIDNEYTLVDYTINISGDLVLAFMDNTDGKVGFIYFVCLEDLLTYKNNWKSVWFSAGVEIEPLIDNSYITNRNSSIPRVSGL